MIRPSVLCLVSVLVALALCVRSPMHAASIGIASVSLYVHDSTGPVGNLDSSAGGYFTTLDSNNEGSFGWSLVNNGFSPLSDLKLLVFLDADLDRENNTFFNEYGEFVGLVIPPTAPLGATAATGWEIDEPGYLFGDITANLLTGILDNSNAVPSSAPDDVSLAMLFQIGSLDPGRRATLTMTISRSNINGVRQVDPDSESEFYLNGYATVDLAPPMGEVPEPSTSVLLLAGLTGMFLRARKRF